MSSHSLLPLRLFINQIQGQSHMLPSTASAWNDPCCWSSAYPTSSELSEKAAALDHHHSKWNIGRLNKISSILQKKLIHWRFKSISPTWKCIIQSYINLFKNLIAIESCMIIIIVYNLENVHNNQWNVNFIFILYILPQKVDLLLSPSRHPGLGARPLAIFSPRYVALASLVAMIAKVGDFHAMTFISCYGIGRYMASIFFHLSL